MIAPLEMLRKLVTNPPVCRSSPHKIVAVTVPELCAAIAAIEERDAEIATLTRQLAEAREFGEKAAKLYNDTLVLRCAFCGEAYEDGTPPSRHERLTDHVKVCPAHPMRDVERQLAEAKAQRDEFDRLASVERERANGLEYQCGIYEARLFRYEQAEKQIWERTPSWLGEQLPALAAYLVKIETERDAMRGALREIADGLPCERDCTAIPPMNCDACGTHRDAPWCAGCIARRALGAL